APVSAMGYPRRPNQFVGYRIGGDQSGGNGTILQPVFSPMSESGQTRSFGDVGPMSGFPKSGNAGHRQAQSNLTPGEGKKLWDGRCLAARPPTRIDLITKNRKPESRRSSGKNKPASNRPDFAARASFCPRPIPAFPRPRAINAGPAAETDRPHRRTA